MILLKKVYYLLILINIIVLAIGYKKITKPFTPFLILLPLVFITQLAGDFSKVYHFNKYPAYHIYIAIELLLLSAYYYRLFRSRKNKILLAACLLLFVVFLLSHYYRNPAAFFEAGFFDFVVASVVIIICTIIYFIEEINMEKEEIFYQNPSFWINIGNLFFYTGCLFVMGFNLYLESHYPSLSEKLIYINYSLNLLLYLLYIKAFVCILKVKKLY